MLSINAVPYKIRLISIYISTTLLGITLILVATFNASHEQLILNHINNVSLLFSDRIIQIVTQTDKQGFTAEQLADDLSSANYKVLALSDLQGDLQGELQGQSLSLGDCELSLDWNLLQQTRLNSQGGVVGESPCLISWVVPVRDENSAALVVLHHLDVEQQESIVATYINRLLLPLLFFVWVTIWGSLMLGNLVNRLQKQKEEVEHMAMHDALTGLPNRKYFSEKISELISFSDRQHTPFILAMIDLNKFKNVNDELGHHSGDLLLKQIAHRFKAGIRHYDMVARLGGDEFILLLMGANIESSLVVLQRIYQSIIEEYQLLDEVVTIGASIGVSYYPQHDGVYSELLQKADSAMYLAKQSGGGIKLYEPGMLNKSAN